jgi:hypothetical protein
VVFHVLRTDQVFAKDRKIELFPPEKLKNAIKIKDRLILPYLTSLSLSSESVGSSSYYRYVFDTQGAQERKRRLVNRRAGTGGAIAMFVYAIVDMEVVYGAEALGGSCR